MAKIHGKSGEEIKSVSNALVTEPVNPRTPIGPDVSASPQSRQTFGDGATTIRCFYAIVNAADDVVASERFASAGPGVHVLKTEETYDLVAGATVQRVHIAGLAATASTTAPSAGDLAAYTSASSIFIDAMVRFDFDSGDQVRSLRVTNTVGVGTNREVFVEGGSDA